MHIDAVSGPLLDAQRDFESRLASYSLYDVLKPMSEKHGIPID